MQRQKHVLVTGASGVLGWRLVQHFRRRKWSVEGSYCQNFPSLEGVRFRQLDLGNPLQVRSLAAAGPYDLVVHTAALTSPDECEKDPQACQRINVESTRLLAENLPEDVRFVFVSTDLVFDGYGSLYRETDTPNPVNRYGESKLAAEQIVLQRPRAVVVRMAKIYAGGSPYHPCFAIWMKDRFEAGDRVPLFYDQYRSPLYVGDMGPILESLFESDSTEQLFHAGGPERLSRYELGISFAQTMGYPSVLIDRVSANSLSLTPRGEDCSLDSSRLFQVLGRSTTPVSEGMQRLKKDLASSVFPRR